MTGTGFDWSALPNRRVMIGSLVGALAGGSLLGLIIGILAPFGTGDAGTANTVAAGATGAATAPASTSARALPTASPTRTTFKPVKTTTLAGFPIPQGFVDHPENDRTMFLAVLQAMNSGDPQHVLIYVRAAQVLSGPQAQAWYQNQGQQPRNLAVVPQQDAPVQELTLQNDAAFWGSFAPGGGRAGTPRRLQFGEFVGLANGVLGADVHPGIWIKRTLGPANGPVVYLAEQRV